MTATRTAAAGKKLSNPHPGYNGPGFRAAGLCLAALASAVGPLAGQEGSWVVPGRTPAFEFPMASPRASALVGRIVHVSRNESRFGSEWEAEPGLGEVLSLFAIARGEVPITLHLGAQVYGRYSLGDAASAQISNDWHVNLIASAIVNRWDFALEAYHESSHLGDEYRDRFGVSRVDWSRGILGAWAGLRTGRTHLRANASIAALDALDLPRGALALSADYTGKPGTALGVSAMTVAALHADAQAYTDWRPTYSGRAGIRFAEGPGGKGLAVLLTFLSGQSTQRQFYSQRSRYVGMEVRFDL